MNAGSSHTTTQEESMQSEHSPADALDWREGAMPTEEEIATAMNLGVDASVIERMKAEGMDRSTYYHVVPALMAQRHLAEKYGVSFQATAADIESTDDENKVAVTLRALDGQFAREEFTSNVIWRTGETPSFAENYFCAVRDEEYRHRVTEMLAPAITASNRALYVLPALGTYLWVGDDYDAETPIDDVIGSCDGNLAIVFGPDETLTEEAYRAELARITSSAAEINPNLFYEAGYLSQTEPYDDELNADIAVGYLRSNNLEHRSMCIWRTSGTVTE